MQIRESHSYTTTTSEDQNGLSPMSPSTPSDFDGLQDYLKEHVEMVIESLGSLSLDASLSPTSPATPFQRVSFANIDDCQQDLSWDHLPDDIWTDDIVQWLDETIHPAVEVRTDRATHATNTSRWSSSTSSIISSEAKRCTFPCLGLPPLYISTNIQSQTPFEQNLYSPSVYSQDDSGFNQGNPHPLGRAARELMKDIADAPINQISMHNLLEIAAKVVNICTELRATINQAQDSAEFDDSKSDSDVTMLDLDPTPPPAIDYGQMARARRLFISNSNPLGGKHSCQHSGTQSYLRIRHYISPDIHNRITCLTNKWAGHPSSPLLGA